MQDFRFNPISRGGTDNLITPSPRRPELFNNARSLAAAHQDFVLHALKLTASLLEVLLLAFLDLSLVDEHGFVHRIIEPLRVQRCLEYWAVGCLQAHDFGGERWIGEVVPDENANFANVVFVETVDDEREASLLAMRRAMLSRDDPDAAVFIGGMEGVLEEYEIFTQFHPSSKVVASRVTWWCCSRIGAENQQSFGTAGSVIGLRRNVPAGTGYQSN